MKFLYIFLLMGSCHNTSKTMETPTTPSDGFPVGVYFGSVCCGPSSADFLSPFVKKYNSAHEQKITGFKVGGCGREGEYMILLNLPAMEKTEKDTWMADLASLVNKQEKINKAAKTNPGGIEIRENLQPADYEFCRIKMTDYSF